jgi:hypothetical protein
MRSVSTNFAPPRLRAGFYLLKAIVLLCAFSALPPAARAQYTVSYSSTGAGISNGSGGPVTAYGSVNTGAFPGGWGGSLALSGAAGPSPGPLLISPARWRA